MRPNASQWVGQLDAGAFDPQLQLRRWGQDFQDACGIEKSAVSENFIEASRAKVQRPPHDRSAGDWLR